MRGLKAFQLRETVHGHIDISIEKAENVNSNVRRAHKHEDPVTWYCMLLISILDLKWLHLPHHKHSSSTLFQLAPLMIHIRYIVSEHSNLLVPIVLLLLCELKFEAKSELRNNYQTIPSKSSQKLRFWAICRKNNW